MGQPDAVIPADAGISLSRALGDAGIRRGDA